MPEAILLLEIASDASHPRNLRDCFAPSGLAMTNGGLFMKILFIGDIVGEPGRRAVKELVPKIKKKQGVEFVVANGENAAGGSGITPQLVDELLGYGVDCLTSGDHIWKKKEILDYIDSANRLLRPANYPSGVPGSGSSVRGGRRGP